MVGEVGIQSTCSHSIVVDPFSCGQLENRGIKGFGSLACSAAVSKDSQPFVAITR